MDDRVAAVESVAANDRRNLRTVATETEARRVRADANETLRHYLIVEIVDSILVLHHITCFQGRRRRRCFDITISIARRFTMDRRVGLRFEFGQLSFDFVDLLIDVLELFELETRQDNRRIERALARSHEKNTYHSITCLYT